MTASYDYHMPRLIWCRRDLGAGENARQRCIAVRKPMFNVRPRTMVKNRIVTVFDPYAGRWRLKSWITCSAKRDVNSSSPSAPMRWIASTAHREQRGRAPSTKSRLF